MYAGQIDEYLLENAKPGNDFEALLRLRLLPIGERGIAALFKRNKKTPPKGDWLPLTFPGRIPHKPRLIYNVFSDLTGRQWAFLVRTFSERQADADLVAKMLPLVAHSKSCPLPRLAKIFESDRCLTFPQSLVAYTNFTARFASPDSIDLDGESRTWISLEKVVRYKSALPFPLFSEGIRLLNAANKPGSTIDIQKELRRLLDNADESPDGQAIGYLCKCVNADFLAGKNKPKRESRIRYLQEIPYLLSALSSEGKPEANGRRQRAIGYLTHVDPDLGARLSLLFKLAKYSGKGLFVRFLSLEKTYALFGLDRDYPPLHSESDLAAAAVRVIVILLSTGRRLSCLTDVTIADFIEWENRFSVRLGRTKVDGEDHASIPLSALLSERDLVFIRAFHNLARSSCFANANLLELAGVPGEFLNKNPTHTKIDSMFGAILKSALNISKKPRLHDLRRMALSWLSVRFTLALHPEMTACRLLADHRSNDLFLPDSLARLNDELGPHTGVDIHRAIASLAGHSSRQTLRTCYNYAMPVLVALYASKVGRAIQADILNNEVSMRIRELLLHERLAQSSPQADNPI